MVAVTRFIITWWWVAVLGVVSFVPTLIGLYIAWRAMRAHEKLASAADQMARRAKHDTDSPI
jgi:hypothetical protein